MKSIRPCPYKINKNESLAGMKIKENIKNGVKGFLPLIKLDVDVEINDSIAVITMI